MRFEEAVCRSSVCGNAERRNRISDFSVVEIPVGRCSFELLVSAVVGGFQGLA